MRTQPHMLRHAQTYSHIYTPHETCTYTHPQKHTYTDIYIYKCTRITLSLKKKACKHIFIETLQQMYKIITIIIHYECLYFPRTINLLTTILQMILHLFLCNDFFLCVQCNSATQFKICTRDMQVIPF